MISFSRIKSIIDPGISIKKKVIVGSFWLSVLALFSRILAIIQTIILARLLAPEHFGIIAVFFIISEALENFTETGFKKALTQRERIESIVLNTAWSVAVIRGISLFLIVYWASPLILALLNAPSALPVVRILGLSLTVTGFNNVGVIYFKRRLEFHKLFYWKSLGLLANLSTSIPLAFILKNEWAIVWGLLASKAVELLLSYLLHPYRPTFEFNNESFKELFTYGKWLLLSAIVMFFSNQGDKIVVSKMLGQAELGIYSIALRFATIPQFLSNQVISALFPAYAKFQKNLVTLKSVYLRSIDVISFICIPLTVGAMVLAKPFIILFIGNKWLPSVLPMQILLIATLLNVITTSGKSLYNALAKPSFTFSLNLVWLIALAISIYPLTTHHGIIGVSLAYLVRSLAGLVFWVFGIKRLLRITGRDHHVFLFPILSSCICFFTIHNIYPIQSITSIFTLLIVVFMALILYSILGLVIHKFTKYRVLKETFELLRLLKLEENQKKMNL